MTRRNAKAQKSPATNAQITIGPGLLVGLLALLALTAASTWWWINAATAPAPLPAVDAPASAPDAAEMAPAAEPGTGFTPEGDPFIGAADAPVTIVEFSDFQCPNCRQFATQVLPWLREGWLARGFVKVVFRDFPIRGERSYLAAHAAHCAGEQGRFWGFHDGAFEMAGGPQARELSGENLTALATAMGLDIQAFEACNLSNRHQARIEASDAFARAQGFEGTPTYLVNGRKTQGAIEIADWDRLFQLFEQDLGQGAAAPGS